MGRIKMAREIAEENGLDLVTAETLRLRLIGVTRQMFNNLMRSAFSTVVRDIVDMTVAIHLIAEEGSEMCAVSEGCLQHAVTAQQCVNLVVQEWGRENLNPGDVIICNDGYRGAIHQADINLIRPVFFEGKLVFYLHDLSHLVDLGGMHPGAFWQRATDYYQEGLLIPPMLIYSRDVPVRSTFNLILENTRTPLHNLGDLRALYGTLVMGERLLQELISRYGLETVRAGARYAMDYTENSMRRALSELPDGVYSAEDFMDDDGITEEPLKLKLTIIKKGSSAELDWSGTQRQCAGPTKTSTVDIFRPLIGVKMVLDPEPPVNSGLLRPFDMVIPPGCMVMALPPASYSDHGELSGRTPSLGYRAIGKADPSKEIGADTGHFACAIFSGIDTRPGKGNAPFGSLLVTGGGWGGTSIGDGASYSTAPGGANLRSSVFEHIEAEMPLRVWEWGTLIDSAGAGKYRGGLGAILTVEILCDNISFTSLGERSKFPPPGVHGAGDGSTSYIYYVKKDQEGRVISWNGVTPASQMVPISGLYDKEGRPDPINGTLDKSILKSIKVPDFRLNTGQVVRIVACGGAGWEDPLERDIDKVERDVHNEWVSIEAAEEYYGVIIDRETMKADESASARKRLDLREKRARGEWQVPRMRYPKWPL